MARMDGLAHQAPGAQAWVRQRALGLRQGWAPAHGLYLALPAHWPVQADEPAVLDEALQAFETWCEAHPGARCELALSAAATLWWVVRHEQANADALALAWDEARGQWAHYLDVDLRQPEVLAAWQLQEAHAPGCSLLAATPLALSAGLMDVAQRHGVRLQWLGAWWVRGLANWLRKLAPPEVHGDVAWPVEQDLILSEPGWSWRAQLSCREAQPGPGPAWLWRHRASPWVLSQLEVDGDGALSSSPSPLPAARPGIKVHLEAPGVSADHAQCVAIDLSVLQGIAPVWTPA
jgi:hypothetical protein